MTFRRLVGCSHLTPAGSWWMNHMVSEHLLAPGQSNSAEACVRPFIAAVRSPGSSRPGWRAGLAPVPSSWSSCVRGTRACLRGLARTQIRNDPKQASCDWHDKAVHPVVRGLWVWHRCHVSALCDGRSRAPVSERSTVSSMSTNDPSSLSSVNVQISDMLPGMLM